jgi:uncharacterized protein (TIGR02246 family)
MFMSTLRRTLFRRHHGLPAVVLICAVLGTSHARADAGSEADAVFDRFLAAFTESDYPAMLALFAPDALFWGTGSQTLVTTPEGVASYFAAMQTRASGDFVASRVSSETRILSADAALLSGIWQVQGRQADSATPLRVSLVVSRREQGWQIVQFHNSTVPQ